MIKSNMKRIRIYATIVSVVFSLHHYTANAAEPVFQLSEISENEFSEAFPSEASIRYMSTPLPPLKYAKSSATK